MQQQLNKIASGLAFFIELQLLITVVIIPIMTGWGISISYMSLVGNLIFAQILSLFILTSTALFCANLCAIPDLYIRQILELITNIWYYFLSYGSAQWLVGFPTWTMPISILSALYCLGLYQARIANQKIRIAWLTIGCLLTPMAHYIFQPAYQHIRVEQGRQTMHIIKVQSKLYAFDCGALGARPSSKSWIEYTLSQAMIKALGATRLDALIICKANSRTPKAVADLISHIPTGAIIYADRIKPETKQIDITHNIVSAHIISQIAMA